MIIQVNNLTKKIKKKTILKDINLEFESGKYYGFLGNNGAGKTTLVKCIFNEYDYQEGDIYLNQKKLEPKEFKKMYYFPDNNDLPKNLSIYDFLETQFLFNKGNLKDFAKKLQTENNYFKDLNLKTTIISSLSSGQQKLVSLLACKILEPEIIFFDEPTTNLDISNKQLIVDEIKKIDVSNKIVVIITHLVDEFKNLLNEIIILNKGSVAYQGLAHKDVKKQFLEVVGYEEINHD